MSQSTFINNKPEVTVRWSVFWFAVAIILVFWAFAADISIVLRIIAVAYAVYQFVNIVAVLLIKIKFMSMVEIIFSGSKPLSLSETMNRQKPRSFPLTRVKDIHLWKSGRKETLALFVPEDARPILIPLTNGKNELIRKTSELEVLAAVINHCSIPDSLSVRLAPKGSATVTSLGKQEIIVTLDRLSDKRTLV